MAWMLRLVKTGAEGEGPCADVMEINRPDDLGDIASLGLTLAEAKRLLAGVQQGVVQNLPFLGYTGRVETARL